MSLKPTTVRDVTIKLESISLNPERSGWRSLSEKRIGELESGNTWLNAHLVDVMAPHAPFGGIRTSVSPRPSSFPPPSYSSASPDEIRFLDPLLLALHQDLI